MPELTGSRTAPDGRFAIVVAEFNDFITSRLLKGAREALAAAAVPDAQVTVLRVPGAFEIPVAARRAAESRRFDAVVCLGCLIKGATWHFEYIASACAHGIAEAASATGVPMAFGVLTTNSAEEALERAMDGPANKGYESALAAVQMTTLLRQLDAPRS